MLKKAIAISGLVFISTLGFTQTAEQLKKENKKLKSENEKLKLSNNDLKAKVDLCTSLEKNKNIEVRSFADFYDIKVIKCKGDKTDQSVSLELMITQSKVNQQFNYLGYTNGNDEFAAFDDLGNKYRVTRMSNSNQEKEKKRLEEEQILKEIQEHEHKMEQAVETKAWLKLNEEEFEELKEFIYLNDMKAINSRLRKREDFQKYYDIELKLQELGLIYINLFRREIEFAPGLEESIFDYLHKHNSNVAENLSFSLAKKLNKTSVKQPDYGGTFNLTEDVLLKANQDYIYSAWVQTDGSINLKFTPLKELQTKTPTKPTNKEKKNLYYLDRMPNISKNFEEEPPF